VSDAAAVARPARAAAPWRRIVDPAIMFALLALLWEKSVDLFQIKQYLLPPLSKVLATAWSSRAVLLRESWITTLEIVQGFGWALVAGVALAMAIHASAVAQRTVYPLIVAFQGLPKIALAPLMVVWVGYGTASKVLMAFLFAFFPVVIGTLGGLASTAPALIEHFRAIRASRWTTFRRLHVPSALPAVIDGAKTAMPLAVIGAIVGEFVGSEAGLGHLILEANANGRTDLLFAALLMVSAVAGVLYLAVELVGRRVWWRAL
jgi:NitT/TauT family transport system permease protein